MDLAPEQTTATGKRARAPRSELTSSVSEAPRWTPPIPPVANTPMPARCAASIVAATVVEPVPPATLVGGAPPAAPPGENPERGGPGARRDDRRLHVARDLHAVRRRQPVRDHGGLERHHRSRRGEQIGRASCRERE